VPVEIDIAARLVNTALIAGAGLIDKQAPDLGAVAGELGRLDQRDARAGRNCYGLTHLAAVVGAAGLGGVGEQRTHALAVAHDVFPFVTAAAAS